MSLIHVCLFICLFFRKVWQELGDLSKEDAMLQFCNHLNKKCVQLKPYIEAHRREKEEQERIRYEIVNLLMFQKISRFQEILLHLFCFCF